MNSRSLKNYLFLATLLAASFPGSARAADYVITLKDHKFAPQETIVPADRKVSLSVRNLDPTPAEFQSWELNREIRLDPHSEVTVYISPLDPGRYRFYDGYARFGEKSRRDTTFGFLTAK